METKKYNFDYTELDEYLSHDCPPDFLDRYFRGFHAAFTMILQDLVSSDEAKDCAFPPDSSQPQTLNEFFQIIGNLKEGGKS